jgi:hypothetical protein
MDLKRVFWAMLAGVSFSLSGCDEENPPADGADTPDMQDVQPDEGMGDAYGPPDFLEGDIFEVIPDGRDAADGIQDTAAEDPADEDSDLPSILYGPP